MSVYQGRNTHPDYLRNHDEDARGRDKQAKRDRGRRQGETARDSSRSSERGSMSSKVPHRQSSPERVGRTHDLSRSNSLPSARENRPSVLSEPGTPLPFPARPVGRDAPPVQDPKPSISGSGNIISESRDPRLLNRINASRHVSNGNTTLRSSTVDSTMLPSPASDENSNRFNGAPGCGDVQKSRQEPAMSTTLISPSTRTAAAEQLTDPFASFVGLMSSLFNTSSQSSALKYDRDKVRAKASHLAHLDKQMGDQSKAFPGHAESSAIERKNTQNDLDHLNQKLEMLQMSQSKLLSTMPSLLQAIWSSSTKEKERELMDMVHRCVSTCDELKSEVNNLTQKLDEYKAVSSNKDQRLEHTITASAEKIENLSLQIQSAQKSAQAGGSESDKRLDEMERLQKSSDDKTEAALAALKTDLRHCADHDKHQKIASDSTTEMIGRLASRVGPLEHQHHLFIASDAHLREEIELLKKQTDEHFRELNRKLESAASKEEVNNFASVMNKDSPQLRQFLLDINHIKSREALQAQAVERMKAENAALRSEMMELKKNRSGQEGVRQLGQKTSSTNAQIQTATSNLASMNKNQHHSVDWPERLRACEGNLTSVQCQLEEKKVEEDTRDEAIAAEVDQIKSSMKDLGGQCKSLEAEMQKLKARETEKAKMGQERLPWTSVAQSQISTPQVSPPIATFAPRVAQTTHPHQGIGGYHPPATAPISANTDARLDRHEGLLRGVMQRLQILNMACQQLDHRYNNLSTEPVVRAMVQHMQMMYPYASDAQREILNLKQMIGHLSQTSAQAESLRKDVERHEKTLGNIEREIHPVEQEGSKNDSKHERLVEFVRLERDKLVEAVNDQKESLNTQKDWFDSLVKRVDGLEQAQTVGPDDLALLNSRMATELRVEFKKMFEQVSVRLEPLEAESQGRDLLGAFTRTFPPPPLKQSSPADIPGQEDNPGCGSLHVPTVETNGSTATVQPSSPESFGIERSLSKSTSVPGSRKRKRFGDQENNDRSDDETYAPSPRGTSSTARRKMRGS